MKKLTAALGAVLLASSISAVASEENRGVYLGSSLTEYLLDKERSVSNDSEDSTVLGLNLGYRFADSPIAIELGYGADIAGESMDVLKLDGLYHLTRRDGWAPYFVLSYTDADFDDSVVPGEDSSRQLGAGFGLSKTWGTQWEFRGDGRFYEKLSNGVDATDLAFSLGLNYYFEAAPEPEVEPMPVVEPEPAPPVVRTITVKLNVEFEFDKAKVLAIYGDELLAVANAMKTHDDIELQLEGHTDSKGAGDYNLDLSLRRVEAVKAKLVDVYGLPGDRISTVGYGEGQPLADNDTEEGRARNRRVIGELSFDEIVSE